MKIIIVGGGKLGKDIADNMLERKYDVRLIEKNRAKCKLDVAFCSVRNLRDSPKTGIAPTVLSLSRVCQTTVFFT